MTAFSRMFDLRRHKQQARGFSARNLMFHYCVLIMRALCMLWNVRMLFRRVKNKPISQNKRKTEKIIYDQINENNLTFLEVAIFPRQAK